VVRFGNSVAIRERSDREPRQVSGPECSGLDAARALDDGAEQVTLKLHQQLVFARAAVDA
jgi:hypothetical protein